MQSTNDEGLSDCYACPGPVPMPKEEYAVILVEGRNIESGTHFPLHLFYSPGNEASASDLLGTKAGATPRYDSDGGCFDLQVVGSNGQEVTFTFNVADDDDILEQIPTLLYQTLDMEENRGTWAAIDEMQYKEICRLNLNNQPCAGPDYKIVTLDLPFGYEERLSIY